MSLLLWCKVSFSQEIEITFDQINSIIKPSKVAYENAYLFIGRVVSIKDVQEAKQGHKKQGHKNIGSLIHTGDYIEILTDKSVCYDEVYLSFLLERKFRLSIKNIKTSMFIPKPNNKEYSFFLKIAPVTNETKSNASCVVSKL
ncbi:MAG: hypothetical protein CL916_14670 [Deltaproteobacteria bacterium]|nr:hypothetical protein [Deltaproteobacteria bacterium]